MTSKKNKARKSDVRKTDDKKKPVPSSPKQLEFEPCPLCGARKPVRIRVRDGREVRPLTCRGCTKEYSRYAQDLAEKITAGENPKILTKPEWLLEKLDLDRFEREVEEARETNDRLYKAVMERVRKAGNGRALPRPVFCALRERYQLELGQKQAYARFRRLQARLEAAQRLRTELPQIIAAKLTTQTSVSPTLQ